MSINNIQALLPREVGQPTALQVADHGGGAMMARSERITTRKDNVAGLYGRRIDHKGEGGQARAVDGEVGQGFRHERAAAATGMPQKGSGLGGVGKTAVALIGIGPARLVIVGRQVVGSEDGVMLAFGGI